MQNIEYQVTDRTRENLQKFFVSITNKEPRSPRPVSVVKKILKIGGLKAW